MRPKQAWTKLACAISAPFLSVACAFSVPAGAQSLTASAQGYASFVTEAATRFGIPETWIRAVMRIESGGNPRAVSRAGAMGLMQIMPSTWAELSARYDLGTNPFDPRASILGGAAYLHTMHQRYGDLEAALAAYNAGPARVDAWRSTGRSLPAETRNYVAKLGPALASMGGSGVIPTTPSWREAALFTHALPSLSRRIPSPNAFPAPLQIEPNATARHPLFAVVGRGGRP